MVAREKLERDELLLTEIVVPGTMTTAFLTLRLALGAQVRFRELPFERIPDEVASGRADAGLLLHEGQATFFELGLHKVLDLGEWWMLETGLPLPLGVTVAHRELDSVLEISEILRESIQCGLEHRDQALDYALQFGRGIDAAVADRESPGESDARLEQPARRRHVHRPPQRPGDHRTAADRRGGETLDGREAVDAFATEVTYTARFGTPARRRWGAGRRREGGRGG